MAGLKTALTGYATYKGREGHINFLLHRITGLGTGISSQFIFLDTALVYFNPTYIQRQLSSTRNTYFGIGEILLVFCVFFPTG